MLDTCNPSSVNDKTPKIGLGNERQWASQRDSSMLWKEACPLTLNYLLHWGMRGSWLLLNHTGKYLHTILTVTILGYVCCSSTFRDGAMLLCHLLEQCVFQSFRWICWLFGINSPAPPVLVSSTSTGVVCLFKRSNLWGLFFRLHLFHYTYISFLCFTFESFCKSQLKGAVTIKAFTTIKMGHAAKIAVSHSPFLLLYVALMFWDLFV